MSRIGILAYGSLIDDPGKELVPFIRESIANIKTPFSIEFARSSNSRDGAPTLIPVEDEGAQVQGVILVLDSDVGLQKAEDLLWRRETRNECSDKHYSRPTKPNANFVVIEHIENLANVDTALFTKIGANIENRNPDYLADLAIFSARRVAGDKKMDGISYLISVKKQRIQTPLMPDYEEAILRKTNAQTLNEAYQKIRSGDV
jgi:cation transport regulator ChaC